MSFEVLVVCTGNICRSPAAELLLQHHLGDSVHVTSAGTHALVDHPIDPDMAALMPAEVDCAGFRARLLDAEMLAGADLVLTLTRAHRSFVVEMLPAAMRRTFTLKEMARILELPEHFEPQHDPAEFLDEAVGPAASARQLVHGTEADDDVPDPYRRGDEAFRVAYAQVADATGRIARACLTTPPEE